MSDINQLTDEFFAEHCNFLSSPNTRIWNEEDFAKAFYTEYAETHGFSRMEVRFAARRRFMLKALAETEVPQSLKDVIERLITGQ